MDEKKDLSEVPYEEFVGSGLLDAVLFYSNRLDDVSEELALSIVFEASFILSIVVTGPSMCYKTLIANGLFTTLRGLLQSGDQRIAKNALFIIGNMMSDDISFSKRVIETQLLHLVICTTQTFSDYESVAEAASWVAFLAVDSAQVIKYSLEESLIDFEVATLRRHHQSVEVLRNCLHAISSFVSRADKDSVSRIDKISRLNLSRFFLVAMESKDADVSFYALNTLAHLASDKQEYVSAFFTPDMASRITKQLEKDSLSVQTTAIYLCTNLVLTDQLSCQALFDKYLIEQIIKTVMLTGNVQLMSNGIQCLKSFLAYLDQQEYIYFLEEFKLIDFLFSLLTDPAKEDPGFRLAVVYFIEGLHIRAEDFGLQVGFRKLLDESRADVVMEEVLMGLKGEVYESVKQVVEKIFA